ncbi:MAG: PQQ-binding-like beta-propeller repeat protein [Gemmatimonadales bacterium]
MSRPKIPATGGGLAVAMVLVVAAGCARHKIAAAGGADGTDLSGPTISAATVAPHTPGDWPLFGWDATRSNAPSIPMGISADNVGRLRRQRVVIDGTVDASAIYLRDVSVSDSEHDAFFVTTTYGKTLAIDANHGTVLWEYTPASYQALKGSAQITTATPAADPDRRFLYAASPDGAIQKLAVADGRVIWHTVITELPQREKIASALNLTEGGVLAVTGGYIGDAPPYQGHVVLLDAGTGSVLHVWNSLCSDQRELIDPSTCRESDSAIWGRAGAVVDPVTGGIFVATGNGLWDGRTNWGDAVIELDPDLTHILGNYTPTNTRQLNVEDADLGSTSPVLLGSGLVAQGGKDGRIRLLDWAKMRRPGPHLGGERQTVSTPGRDDLFTAPAVLHDSGTTWMFAADRAGTTAWIVRDSSLVERWHYQGGGTSPVVVDGLVFVYDPAGALRVHDARTGRRIASLEAGRGHWNSPIVVDRRVALPEGNANDHAESGVLDIWRLP